MEASAWRGGTALAPIVRVGSSVRPWRQQKAQTRATLPVGAMPNGNALTGTAGCCEARAPARREPPLPEGEGGGAPGRRIAPGVWDDRLPGSLSLHLSHKSSTLGFISSAHQPLSGPIAPRGLWSASVSPGRRHDGLPTAQNVLAPERPARRLPSAAFARSAINTPAPERE